MSTEMAALSPVYNPQMQAFVGDGKAINGVTYQNLVEEHGADNVNNALLNLFHEVYVNDIKSQYAGSPIEDDVIEFMDGQLAKAELPTTLDAQADIDDAYRDLMKFYAENRMDDINDEMNPASDVSGISKKDAGGDGSANWLLVLAQAMGAAAGEHLKQAVLSGYRISDISGRADQDTSTQGGRDANAQKAQDMAMEQAKMQAHLQMFKMSFESTATLLKTTGEGLATMGRKS